MGAGQQPITRIKMENLKLASALAELVSNTNSSVTAARLGQQIRLETGVDAVVNLVQQVFS